MIWSCHNPTTILAGPGTRGKLAGLVPQGKLLLVTSNGMVRRGTAEAIMALCPGNAWSVRTVAPNPDLDLLDDAVSQLRGETIAAVVALGGGSAMDSAKALAATLPLQGEHPLAAWLRNGQSRPNVPVLPLFCLPTTAGTGAEVTPFGTIWDMAHRKKRSVAHDALYPKAAILDLELTLSLPWPETLWGAMDAISHCLETIWNKTATPVSMALALEGLALVGEALPFIRQAPDSLPIRERLQQASLLAGLAISQSRTAIAHGLSYPVTITFGVPHGLACSFTLPAIADLVAKKSLWPSLRAEEAALRAVSLVRGFDLAAYMRGYCSPEAVLALVDAMFDPTRTDNFVVAASRDEVIQILRDSL